MEHDISKLSEIPKASECDYYDVTHVGMYCGTCKEKRVHKNTQTFNQRDAWVNKSVSTKPKEEIRASYNKKYNVKESDYWRCYQEGCDLETDDDRIHKVFIFKKRSLMESYRYRKPLNHNFWD